MIILNLLPPDKKILLASEHNLLQIKRAAMIFLGCGLLVVGLALSCRILLSGELNKLDEEINQIKQSSENTGNTAGDLIKRIALKSNVIAEAQKNFIPWSSVLSLIGQSAGQNIQLKTCSFDAEKETFQIQGQAKTRNDLLNFKTSLEKLTFLENLNAPITNLIQKEDISFQFSGTLNPENIAKHENTGS
ncbi:MAG: hypothetical protein PHH01_01640 [Patescibacteria group bacterium]|nr:hypothetical protein [Patescibacteria group bacterium]